ncbi:DUF1648 domain-containing protein [Streptomyces sp. HNM0575]|uniref:DUF1648 domain-containing protein n=1 Tax=Streptomyces sp. HNM0575 TaxID=2716338 RepID=UPI00145EA9EC|nr:DUF1648 domain-containing protein [Streptomyces sp. HNM0575]NLU72227.1 DUF1648 domain-containing protein [Streptomyces sp. HNM0575]
MVLSPSVRPWLLPSIVLLATLVTWGAVRYPHLPDRIPKHIGVHGVDAWAARSVGSAFVLVFVYVGVTVLVTACAELTLRLTPRNEMPHGHAARVAGVPFQTLNRPGSRASARRSARALLVLNACVGVSFLVGCAVLWRSTPDPDVPGWMFAALVVPLVAGTALTVVVAVNDRKN